MFPEIPAASHALPRPGLRTRTQSPFKNDRSIESHNNKDVRSRSELGRPLIIIKGIHGSNLYNFNAIKHGKTL